MDEKKKYVKEGEGVGWMERRKKYPPDRRITRVCRRACSAAPTGRRLVDHGPGCPDRSGKAQGEYKVYISDSGAVHRDRRQLVGRRTTVPSFPQTQRLGKNRRMGQRRVSDRPDKPVDHPGYIPGAKTAFKEQLKELEAKLLKTIQTKQAEQFAEIIRSTERIMPVLREYTVKDACLEAIKEDRAHQNKLWMIRSKPKLTPLQIAEGKAVQRAIDSQSGVTDVIKGIIKADPPGSGQLEDGSDRCGDCEFFVPNTGFPELRSGNCLALSPSRSGWPVVNESDYCGEHSLDEEKAK